MKPDTLNQFVKLRQALLAEKTSLRTRLAQIEHALGTQSKAARHQRPPRH